MGKTTARTTYWFLFFSGALVVKYPSMYGFKKERSLVLVQQKREGQAVKGSKALRPELLPKLAAERCMQGAAHAALLIQVAAPALPTWR